MVKAKKFKMIEVSTDEFDRKSFSVILNDIFQLTDELPNSTLAIPNTGIFNRTYKKDTRESNSKIFKNMYEIEFSVKDECEVIYISDSEECGKIKMDNSESEKQIKPEVSDSKYNAEESHTLCHIENDISKHNYHHVCTICGVHNNTQRALEIHYKQTHCSLEGHKLYLPNMCKCNICQKGYDDIKETRNYWDNPCKKNIKCCECHFCQKSFLNTLHMQPHESRHTSNLEERDCKGNHSENTTSNHLKETKPYGPENVKHYECRFCQKSFSKRPFMEIHERRHTGEKPYKCTFCSKNFRQLSNLNQHIVRWHTEKKPYKCSYCSKEFYQLSNLNQHVRRHTEEKPYKCSYCPKDFRQLSNLNQHIMNQHTSDKQGLFHCIICYKQFKTKALLREHDLTHRKEKFYLCYICTKQFTYKWSLQTHIESQHKTNS